MHFISLLPSQVILCVLLLATAPSGVISAIYKRAPQDVVPSEVVPAPSPAVPSPIVITSAAPVPPVPSPIVITSAAPPPPVVVTSAPSPPEPPRSENNSNNNNNGGNTWVPPPPSQAPPAQTTGPDYVQPSLTNLFPTKTSTSKPATDDGSGTNSTNIIIIVSVVTGCVVLAGVGILIFRKWKLKPSGDFKKRFETAF